uniref:Down syndrome cell adhesion molecule homolog n=1 Tax=Cacopsylla melanoneura TaxID=428564 RepID=A0A8D8QGB1_9HEMI
MLNFPNLSKVPPRIQPFSFGEDSSTSVLEQGETASVSCLMLSGDLPISFLWLFNGAPLPAEGGDVSIVQPSKKLSVLSIDALSFEHVGNYSCVANNTAARSVHTAALLVNG